MDYHVRLPVFEGPFELLFHLIKKAEVDIWEISVTDITEQYLNYLREMEEVNLEVTSEFIVMAATLLRLKSRMLLPSSRSKEPEPEEPSDFSIETREELIARLVEYRRFKQAADLFRQWEKQQRRIYFRSSDTRKVALLNPQSTPLMLSGDRVDVLYRYAQQLLTKPDFSGPPTEIPVKDKMIFILKRLSENKNMLAVFDELFAESTNKLDKIVTFLALLELARQNKIYIRQEDPQSPIFIGLQ